MLGKFNGFNVPGRDFERRSEGANHLEKSFCYKSKMIDCLECEFCLFCKHREENNKAFKEWYAAKGKVAYA